MWYPDDDSEDLQVRKVIVIGSVGSGKTSLSRYVSGNYQDNEDSKLSGLSITKGICLYKGKYVRINKQDSYRIQFSMLDSEGYGADSFSGDNLKNQLVNVLKFETELNCVIIVVSFERFRHGLKDDLDHLIGVIQTLGLATEHMLLCFTHCEVYIDDIKQRYYEEFKEYYNIEIDEENVLYGCFTNVGEINDKYRPLIIEDVKQSIVQLRNMISKKSKSVNVAMKIAEIEQ